LTVVLGSGFLDPGIPVPFRAFGFTQAVVEAVAELRRHVHPRVEISFRLFNTSRKLAALSGNCIDVHTATISGLRLLAVQAALLRMAGVSNPITADLAYAARELAADLLDRDDLPQALLQWLDQASCNNGNFADGFIYGVEHPAASMFGDVSSRLQLQVTVGARPEAYFWAIRQHVVAQAKRAGMSVAPSLGVILHGLRRPWYANRHNGELPINLAFTRSPADAAASARDAVKQDYGANRELHAAARYLRSHKFDAELVRAAVEGGKGQVMGLFRNLSVTLGPCAAPYEC